MVYATDLDRTLIYSSKFVSKENFDKLISFPDGEHTTHFMTKKAYSTLKEIKGKIKVIPCTTRSIEQYTRLIEFRDCEYAICDNGATILHNGKINKQWEFVNQKNMEFCKAEILNLKDKLKDQSFVKKEIRFVDSYFLFFKINDKTDCIEWLESNVNKKKFFYNITGEKCYVFPNFVSKENALKYLMDIIGETDLIASGDSELDLGMLGMANKSSFLQVHDDFDFNLNLKNITLVLVGWGIAAGECVLNKVKEILDKEGETND